MAPTRAEAGGSRWNSFCPPHGLPPAVASDISNFSLSSVQQFLSEFSSLCSALCLSGVGCVGMFSVVRSERGLIYVGAAKLCALDCLFFLNNVFAKHPAGGSLLHRTRLPSSVALSSLPREEGKAGEVQAEAERCTLPQTCLPPCPRLRDALRRSCPPTWTSPRSSDAPGPCHLQTLSLSFCLPERDLPTLIPRGSSHPFPQPPPPPAAPARPPTLTSHAQMLRRN